MWLRCTLLIAPLVLAAEARAAAPPGGIATGNCHQDARCFPDWELQRRASVLIYNPNALSACSGTMVNSATSPKKAYLLTALHCLDTSPRDGSLDATEESWAADLEVYFNWDRPCGLPTPAYDDVANKVVGANVVTYHWSSDQLLLELWSPPPVWTNPYYAGWWSAPNDIPVTALHHPRGDVLRLTNGAYSAVYDVYGLYDAVVSNSWYVQDWSDGAIEPGSSGGGIFDTAGGYLVGTVSFKGNFGAFICTAADEDRLGRLVSWISTSLGDGDYMEGFDPYAPAELPSGLGASDVYELAYDAAVRILAPFHAAAGSSMHIYPAN